MKRCGDAPERARRGGVQGERVDIGLGLLEVRLTGCPLRFTIIAREERWSPLERARWGQCKPSFSFLGASRSAPGKAPSRALLFAQ